MWNDMTRLIILAKHSSVRQVDISGQMTTIGRSETNKICIESERISRQHAAIEWTGDLFMLTDMSSRNGTYLNGKKLRSGIALANGDSISIGDCQLRFLYTTQALKDAEALRLLTITDASAAFNYTFSRPRAIHARSFMR